MKQVIEQMVSISYIRKPKPFYKSSIKKLRADELVIAEEEIELQDCQLIEDGKVAKLLFYNDEFGRLHMMVGIGKKEQSISSSNSSMSLSTVHNSSSTFSITQKIKLAAQEEIYFVTIQIEETFLKWLDHPDFMDPLDVIKNL